MKRLFYFIVILLISAGCQDENLPMSEMVGEWSLIQSHQYVGTEIIREGDELEWQEVYVFRSDGTFRKTRTVNSSTTMATGTYTTEEGPLYISRPVKLLVKLTFKAGEDLALSCSPKTEEFDLSSHDGMLRNYSIACENPILTYQKK